MVPTGGTGEEISYRSLSQPSIHFEKQRRQSIFMKTRIKNLLSENTLTLAGVEWGQVFQLHQILHLTISVSPHRLAGSQTLSPLAAHSEASVSSASVYFHAKHAMPVFVPYTLGLTFNTFLPHMGTREVLFSYI